jgi:anti-sigma factor RsiW
MSVEDTDLLAYADDRLSQERRAEVEAAVAESPVLAERLAAMRASALPYAEAFERQAIPPLPPKLTERVNDLLRVSGRVSGPAIRGKSRAGWAVAAALGGVLLCGGALKFWMDAANGSAVSPWVQAVASYQELYARETLASITADGPLTQKILGDSEAAGVAVTIPDLRANGLEFKRVQRLSFHDQPVIQIVYLPRTGDPVALCITRVSRVREAPHFQQLGTMKAAVWQDGALGYVLLAKNAPVDLVSLGRRIARGEMPTLFSSNTNAG